jgi:hypothetical protein
MSISVIGNTSTAIIIKSLLKNIAITLSNLDVSFLLIFNTFQLAYFIFLCKKPVYFGELLR